MSDFKSDTTRSCRFHTRADTSPTSIAAMHLRMPSIDRGVQSFIWAVVFFLFMYFGMVAIEVAKGTAIAISLVAGFLVFLLVRTRGGDDPLDRR